ncbi:MAG: hypothetical protein RLZZ312_1899 [Bacteroidota bacterium]|jgi:hypothetical protein
MANSKSRNINVKIKLVLFFFSIRFIRQDHCQNFVATNRVRRTVFYGFVKICIHQKLSPNNDFFSENFVCGFDLQIINSN